MMNARWMTVTVSISGLLLALAVGLVVWPGARDAAWAQGSGPQGSDAPLAPVGTSFTYQGRLKDASGPVNSTCDFGFSLWDAAGSGTPPTGGNQVALPQTKTNVTVSEGLFTVQLNFGTDYWIFDGSERWLQIAVRCPAGSGTYTTLSPRQPLTAAPYALSLRPGATIHNAASSGPMEGLRLRSNSGMGLHVDQAATDGVYVYQAGNPSTHQTSSNKNGFEVAGAEGAGLYVGRADWDGVFVKSTAQSGLAVESADNRGVWVWSAGDDGVYVHQAGNPSSTIPATGKNGFEVAGAEVYGLYVGRANASGVYVSSAGTYGVAVNAADSYGVYANTTQASHEWGVYTPDKIYAGVTLASGGPLMLVAQNGSSGNLEIGDVVAVSGTGAAFAESESPVALVQRVGPGGSVMGVVYGRFVAEEKVEEVTRDGQVERQTNFHIHSTEGPVAPGDYLLVVVLGPAQVKVEAGSGAGIRPGDLLTAAPGGQAMKATPVTVGEVTFYAPSTVIGQAMGVLDKAQGSGLIWMLVMPQ